jgi:hypothetical protein
MRELFQPRVIDMVTGVVDMMDRYETVAFPVTRTNTEGQFIKGTFLGGRDSGGGDGSPWDRGLTVEIEPNSMEHVNRAAQQAAMQAAQTHVMNVSAAYMQNPALKPQPMIDDMMEASNVKRGSDRYIDLAFLRPDHAAQMVRCRPRRGMNQQATGRAAGRAPQSARSDQQLQRKARHLWRSPRQQPAPAASSGSVSDHALPAGPHAACGDQPCAGRGGDQDPRHRHRGTGSRGTCCSAAATTGRTWRRA